MIENIIDLNKRELVENVKIMMDEGYRFITTTCVETEHGFHVLYHFAKEYDMKHFKVHVLKDEELESISNVCFCAMLVENEMKDLFGVKISNIVIDYNGKLLLSEGAPYAPMCSNDQIQIEVKED